MTPERWARLTEIFDAAIERPLAERPAFLVAACPEVSLRRDVERLLDSHERAEQTDFGNSAAFQVTADVTLEAGARLGRYEVIALLGRGGMGNVYRARDPLLDREVAIKVLRHRGDITPDDLQRFERETRAAGALHHPNVLAVYDVGTADGAPFVVSELLEGETLRARLARGPLPVTEAADVARQIISGVAAAHDRGIIHRDLKPENLFLTREGIVRILDFGLAKQVVDGLDPETDPAEGGLLMGTAGYMAPEQVVGKEADERSDLFAFGALLYEMLTGSRAFNADSAAETMQAVLTTDPAGVDARHGHLGAIATRCLAKNPADRFASARAVDAALEAAAVSDTVQRGSPARRVAYVAAAALVVAGAIAAVMTIERRQVPPRPGVTGRPAVAVLPFEDRSGDDADAWRPAGVASMFVTSLAQTPGLDVIGTERLEALFRDLRRPASDRSAGLEAARRAGAGAVLFGTLFKTNAGVGLDVQVQDVTTGRIVVARSAQGPDLFGLVDVVAGDVRDALDVANRSAGRPLRDVTTTSLDAYALYVKAQAARHNNRLTDARTLFQEALRIDPAFTLARAQMVTMLDRLGEAGAAANERRIIAGQLDRLPERERVLAEAAEESGNDPSRAIALLEQLLTRYPDDEEAYDAIIHAYTHTHDPAYWKKSLPIMERWARAIPGPGSGHFHNHYGYAYIEHGLFTEAEREFRAYIRVSPDEANAYDSLGELYLATGRPSLAIENYTQALRLNPQFGWSHFGRAYAHAVEGRYTAAIAELTTLQNLGTRGGVPGVAIRMLDALLAARVGRHADAGRHLDEARRLAGQLKDSSAQADADLFDAMLALERGDHARAILYSGRAARVGTDAPVEIMRIRRSAFALLVAGIADARRDRLDEARARLEAERTLNVIGDDIQSSWLQGLTGEIALAERRFDDAEQAFRAAEYSINSSFAIYPALVVLANNPPFRDGLARTAMARGDLVRARQLYERLNRPDATSTWEAIFEPRYTRAALQLATRLQPSVQPALARP